MSAFDTEWLDLREPVDGRARDPGLLRKAAAFIQSAGRPVVVDIGSGTGSTLRAVAPHIARAVEWRLIDHDRRLLEEAARRHGHGGKMVCHRADLNDVASLPLQDASVVTASALFDLCSQAFVEALATRLAALQTGLYAALSYDGRMDFEPAHPDDGAVLALFNRHQQSDKGFGPALGPRSADVLSKVFERAGYRIEIAGSDWILDRNAERLHRAFVDGVAKAVGETGGLSPERVAEWQRFRRENAGRCRIGHADVLALPSGA
ncbi:MAG: class I SAM-dependent methyltransferase [Phyllobacterium sp.]